MPEQHDFSGLPQPESPRQPAGRATTTVISVAIAVVVALALALAVGNVF